MDGEHEFHRTIQQQLEAWQRSGLTHRHALPPPVDRSTRPLETPRSAHSQPTSSNPLSLNRDGSSMPRRTPKPESTPHANSAANITIPAVQLPPPGTPETFVPLELAPSERVERLAALKVRVAQCMRCQELAETRTQTVFGVGNPNAKILFIGEAPGADEDAQGEPFVGRAGKLLNDIIAACKLSREEIYICNVLRCRPPGNRLPSDGEAANCREFLDGQIAIVNPEYIVCWGSCAAKNLLNSTDAIGKMRGKFYKYGRAKVLCTYHPSYLLRNPPAKKEVWQDMQFLFQDMGIVLKAK